VVPSASVIVIGGYVQNVLALPLKMMGALNLSLAPQAEKKSTQVGQEEAQGERNGRRPRAGQYWEWLSEEESLFKRKWKNEDHLIVIIYNELDNLQSCTGQRSHGFTGETWELILVDDGSTDGSTEAICELAREDKRVRPVIFARNFGHQIAITAGWDYARGNAVVIIDADLQDPPELIL
jgi:hypothetical protein